jgi:hypothetical protein
MKSVEQRFDEKWIVDSVTGCHNWTATKDRDGYGWIRDDGPNKECRAHRFSLKRKLGRPINFGMLACHKCNNPSCVNPEHLYEGTTLDNMKDLANSPKTLKGRKKKYIPKPGFLNFYERDLLEALIVHGFKNKQLMQRFNCTKAIIDSAKKRMKKER